MKMNRSNLILASVVSASMAAAATLAAPVAFASTRSPLRTGSAVHAPAALTVAGTADDDKKGDSKGDKKGDSKGAKDKQKTKTEKPAPAPSGGW